MNSVLFVFHIGIIRGWANVIQGRVGIYQLSLGFVVKGVVGGGGDNSGDVGGNGGNGGDDSSGSKDW